MQKSVDMTLSFYCLGFYAFITYSGETTGQWWINRYKDGRDVFVGVAQLPITTEMELTAVNVWLCGVPVSGKLWRDHARVHGNMFGQGSAQFLLGGIARSPMCYTLTMVFLTGGRKEAAGDTVCVSGDTCCPHLLLANSDENHCAGEKKVSEKVEVTKQCLSSG